METFIIGYMIVNEIAGVAMAVGYVKYLRKSGFFIQRKIEKWRSRNSFTDKVFWDSFSYLEKALKEAKQRGNTELPIVAMTSLDYTYDTIKEYLNPNTTDAPLYVVKYLYLPTYQEMIDSYGIKIIPIY